MRFCCVRPAPLCQLLLALAISIFCSPLAEAATSSSVITAIWANEGGDKVAQEELRATRHVENKTGTMLNRTWNGTAITLSGAHNEVVSFNLILEAAGVRAQNVSVSFDTLTGPGGVQIHSIPAIGNGVFDWTQRPIEVFYIRYLQILGLSYFGYGKWDERQIPVRFQRPWTGNGQATGLWTDRPDHDLHYPDIMVPYDLVNSFAIAAGQNQGIWSDIYIPKTIPSGLYSGLVTIKENGSPTHTVPVQLTVNSFSLPDTPSAKTMIPLDTTDIAWRYVAGYGQYVNWQTPGGLRIQQITDKYFELFHRHRLTVVGQNECQIRDQPCDSSLPRLSGSLYTANHGYDGPGVNTPDGLFSIGTYGTWGQAHYGMPAWQADESLFRQHIDAWATWFQNNLPGTAFHLYLEDEPPPQDYGKVETWAEWINRDPGPGQKMLSLTTHQPVLAQTDFPHVDIPVMPGNLGVCPGNVSNCASPSIGQAVADAYRTTPGFQFWIYNGDRPAAGTAMTEDDGIAMRQIPWMSYKKQVARYMYWYANVNTPWDWFTQALTWGDYQYVDPVLGKTGNTGASNGNGLLVYPGTSTYPGQTSYGVDGPFASLRIKEWRRGIQDVDYLTLAAQYDPASVQQIINQTIPSVLWEYPSTSPSYYTGGGPSWSANPDNWEAARAQLAQIIIAHCANASAAGSPCTDTGGNVYGAPPALPAPVTPINPPSSPTPPVIAPAPPAVPVPAPPAVPIPTPAPVVPVPVVPTPTAPPDTNAANDPSALRFIPISPCRLVDTRLPGSSFGGPFLQGGSSKSFLAFSSPCGIPSSAKAFALNATVVPHTSLRWLTVWPGGEPQPSVSALNSVDGRVKANGLIVPAGINGSLEAFATDDTELILDISGYFVPSTQSGSLVFYPVTPCRLVDTRSGAGSLGGPSLPAARERSFPVLSSSCGLPGNAKAYSLNYTAIPKRGLGWMSTWPSGQPQPVVSTLNAPTGAITANAAITVAGTNGSISVYASDNTDLVIDVNGYFAAPGNGGLSLYTLTPCRAFDSRIVGQQVPIQGQMSVDFAAGSCAVPKEAEALVLNATAIPAKKLSFLTLWPQGAAKPLVSTLNAGDGFITSNLAIVPAQADGISLFSTDPTHLILDIFGYFAP